MASGIIMATVVIGCVGLFVGLFLGIAAIKFRVEVNPKEEEVLNALPFYHQGGNTYEKENSCHAAGGNLLGHRLCSRGYGGESLPCFLDHGDPFHRGGSVHGHPGKRYVLAERARILADVRPWLRAAGSRFLRLLHP